MPRERSFRSFASTFDLAWMYLNSIYKSKMPICTFVLWGTLCDLEKFKENAYRRTICSNCVCGCSSGHSDTDDARSWALIVARSFNHSLGSGIVPQAAAAGPSVIEMRSLLRFIVSAGIASLAMSRYPVHVCQQLQDHWSHFANTRECVLQISSFEYISR